MIKYKVLSLLQPWASLVVMGAKKLETRSWNTHYRGALLIHASARKDTIARGLCKSHPFIADIKNGLDSLPFGAIIGSVNLVETYTSSDAKVLIQNDDRWEGLMDSIRKAELAYGDYSPGRYGWLLSDPVQFAEPIPAKGSLGIWEYEEIIATIERRGIK